MGRYMAGGIQVGDKRELILPRLLQPERVKYYRMLSKKDRENLKRAFSSGMDRRNWRFTKEYTDVQREYRRQRRALECEQKEAEDTLSGTDYQVIKLTEGELTEEEFAPTRARRREARDKVNRCRADIAALEPVEAEALEAVRLRIMNT